MTPERVLKSIAIDGGVNHQAFTTLGIFPEFTGQLQENIVRVGGDVFASTNRVPTYAQYVPEDDPSTVLGRDPTIVTLKLVPIGTQAFATDYRPAVSALAVPQTINTEAP